MKAKNKILTLMVLSAGAAATTAAINKCIQVRAVSKNLMTEPQSLCYRWRLGNIHYTKTGSGKPVLLIHDLKSTSSGYEWNQLINRMKENYTVYTIDLLGCGRSEKPNIVYTNYLYVQLISDFIKSEIGHRTSIIASNESASVPIMACANNPELFDQLMLINPLSLLDYSQIPGKTAKSYKFLIDLPILGTMLYNIANSKKEIKEYFTREAFYNPYSVKANYIDYYYESAQLGAHPKAVYASIECKYTKCNIVNALRKINNSIYLIGGKGIIDIDERLDEYKYYNPSIECLVIPDSKQLPQLESPTELYQIVKTYLG